MAAKFKLELSNGVREARKERGLSQSELAEMVGVSRNTISSIETGAFNPTAKLALILCIAPAKSSRNCSGLQNKFTGKKIPARCPRGSFTFAAFYFAG